MPCRDYRCGRRRSSSSCVATCLAALAPLVIRRAVGFERLVVNNEIAGFQYSTLGTSYAVLLALAVVAVWGDFRDAQRMVDIEASSWVNMFAAGGGAARARAGSRPGRAPRLYRMP